MTVYPDRLHAYLIAKRNFYGAKTPIGHRCSSVVELLENRHGAAGDQLTHIEDIFEVLQERRRRELAAERAAKEPDIIF